MSDKNEQVVLVATFNIRAGQVGQLTELLNGLPAHISMNAPSIAVANKTVPVLLQPKTEKPSAVTVAPVETYHRVPTVATTQPTQGRVREQAAKSIVPTRSTKS